MTPVPDEYVQQPDLRLSQDNVTSSSAQRVQVRRSPYLDVFCDHHTAHLTIDSGATGNMIRASTAKRLGAHITKSSQHASQADGSSRLEVVGETRLTFTRDDHTLLFDGLVLNDLDTETLAGAPFMEINDVSVRPAKCQVIIGNDAIFTYSSTEKRHPQPTARRTQIIRAPSKSFTVWPGDFIEVSIPEEDASENSTFALEPRSEASSSWPPHCLISSISGKIRIPNLSDSPKTLKRNEQFCTIRPVYIPGDTADTGLSLPTTTPVVSRNTRPADVNTNTSQIRLDSDNMMSPELKQRFQHLHKDYADVFDPTIVGYNGESGPFEAKVNMGPVQPPQRKGRLPFYPRSDLEELQRYFDELEKDGRYQTT